MPVSIVLVEPENPDNIGAVARAMMNMDLADLRLVKPPAKWKEKAKKMAVHAFPLLAHAKVFDSLKEALADAHFVLGTTRRQGNRRRAFLEFDDAMGRCRRVAKKRNASVVFGKESKGLSNSDLDLCDWFTTIPTGKEYPSINLAQAAMIACFSLFTGKFKVEGYDAVTKVSKEEFESIMEYFNRAVQALEYKPDIAVRIDRTFRALIKRSGLLKSEGQMFKGFSRRILERTTPKYAGRNPDKKGTLLQFQK